MQGQSTSNASSITQKAAVAALNGDQKRVSSMNAEFKKRHDYFIGALNSSSRHRRAARRRRVLRVGRLLAPR